jgi:hypothetical protein
MRVFSDRLRRRIEAEERYKILEELQSQEEVHYPFLSHPRLFVRRNRFLFEKLGEMLFAMTVAAVALIANYIIFVRLLHFQVF